MIHKSLFVYQTLTCFAKWVSFTSNNQQTKMPVASLFSRNWGLGAHMHIETRFILLDIYQYTLLVIGVSTISIDIQPVHQHPQARTHVLQAKGIARTQHLYHPRCGSLAWLTYTILPSRYSISNQYVSPLPPSNSLFNIQRTYERINHSRC